MGLVLPFAIVACGFPAGEELRGTFLSKLVRSGTGFTPQNCVTALL